MKPRTKAPKGEQLGQELTGELGRYEQVGLSQHALGKKTAYRYRGVLLQYQQPKYVEPKLVERILVLCKDSPRDHLVIRLMTDAGLRRQEVMNLQVRRVGEKALRFAGKRGRDRTVPLTAELQRALRPFCAGKSPGDHVVGLKDKAIYMVVKEVRQAGRQSRPSPS